MRTYYKIKPEFDQKRRTDGSILIANELYTAGEIKKFKIPESVLTKIEAKQSDVYWFFGARFAN